MAVSFSDLNECKKVNGEFKMRFEKIGLDNSPAFIVFIGLIVVSPSSNNKKQYR